MAPKIYTIFSLSLFIIFFGLNFISSNAFIFMGWVGMVLGYSILVILPLSILSSIAGIVLVTAALRRKDKIAWLVLATLLSVSIPAWFVVSFTAYSGSM